MGNNQNKQRKVLREERDKIFAALKDIYEDPDFIHFNTQDMVMWNHYYLRQICIALEELKLSLDRL